MSAQINLYHPRFLKQRELFTLRNVALAATALYAVVGLGGVWAWQSAAELGESALAAEQKLKATKARVDAEIQAAAQRKPSAQLAAEAENAEALVRRRIEIAGLLESGAVGRLTEKVYGKYGPSPSRDAPAGIVGVEIEGSRYDVSKDRPGAQMADSLHRGDEGERCRNDLIAGPNAQRRQSQQQRVGTRVHAHGVGCAR